MSAADVVAVTGSLDLTSLSFNLPPLLPLTAGLTLTLTSPNDADVWRLSGPFCLSTLPSVITQRIANQDPPPLQRSPAVLGILDIKRQSKIKWFTFRFETFEKIAMTFICPCMDHPIYFSARPSPLE